jgi:hypothetical protein
LRASHADREQVIAIIKAAFIQGRLTKDEIDLRVGQALASRTYAELAAITADLPAGLAAAQPPQPAPVPGARPILRRPGMMATVATMLDVGMYVGMWPVAFVLPRNGEGDPLDGVNLVGVATVVYLLVLSVAWVLAQERPSRGGRSVPAVTL